MPEFQYYLKGQPLYTEEDVERIIAERAAANRRPDRTVYFCQRCGQKIQPGTAMPERADLHAGSATCINLLRERIDAQDAIQYELGRMLHAIRKVVHDWNPVDTDPVELDAAVELLAGELKKRQAQGG